MKGKTLLIAQGARPLEADTYGIITRSVYDLSIAKAIKLISTKQADYYLYGSKSIRYYLSKTPK